MIESSSFVVTCGTVLRTYHAFIRVLTGGAYRIGVTIVFALGWGVGTGFWPRHTRYKKLSFKSDVDKINTWRIAMGTDKISV